MEEITFKVGDVVILKSDNINMVIEKFAWDEYNQREFTDRVVCVWHEGTTPKRETYLTSALKLKKIDNTN